MSESMNTQRRNIRLQMLATASASALLVSVCSAAAGTEDTDRPTVWIEVGVQSEQTSGFGRPFSPPFTSEIVADGFQSPLQLQRALGQSFGGESKISFQPDNSDWVFSASVLYGRAAGRKSVHDQTPGGPRHFSFVTSGGTLHTGSLTPFNSVAKFSEARISNDETHTILDFQAGKDVGLGVFRDGVSVFGFGVRVAQFASKQTLGLNADPDFYVPLDIFHNAKYHHTYAVSSHMERSFRGFGPSISWNASAPLIGNADNGGIALDWGINAALLFGRQKAVGHHQSTGAYYKTKVFYHYPVVHAQRSGNPDRSRFIAVPNLGGFAGFSFRFPNAKVSLGYRADFFFGAMDGGIDTRKNENVGFYGPFASVSIGIGG